MNTEYKTMIKLCDLHGKVYHTLRYWGKLTDNEIDKLKESHKKETPEYCVEVYFADERGIYRLSKIIQAIPDAIPWMPEDVIWLDS